MNTLMLRTVRILFTFITLLGGNTILFADAPPETKSGALYQGNWVTTNRKLNGTMNCQVKELSPDQWQGRFWGTWEHVPFDYTVEFGHDNSPTAKNGGRLVSISDKALIGGEPVTGKATIDGAHYDWIGILAPEEFDIKFTGSRYEGHLELKRVQDQIPSVTTQH
jgi:hypothetical protein